MMIYEIFENQIKLVHRNFSEGGKANLSSEARKSVEGSTKLALRSTKGA
jgi:hypothetical protein